MFSLAVDFIPVHHLAGIIDLFEAPHRRDQPAVVLVKNILTDATWTAMKNGARPRLAFLVNDALNSVFFKISARAIRAMLQDPELRIVRHRFRVEFFNLLWTKNDVEVGAESAAHGLTKRPSIFTTTIELKCRANAIENDLDFSAWNFLNRAALIDQVRPSLPFCKRNGHIAVSLADRHAPHANAVINPHRKVEFFYPYNRNPARVLVLPVATHGPQPLASSDERILQLVW